MSERIGPSDTAIAADLDNFSRRRRAEHWELFDRELKDINDGVSRKKVHAIVGAFEVGIFSTLSVLMVAEEAGDALSAPPEAAVGTALLVAASSAAIAGVAGWIGWQSYQHGLNDNAFVNAAQQSAPARHIEVPDSCFTPKDLDHFLFY